MYKKKKGVAESSPEVEFAAESSAPQQVTPEHKKPEEVFSMTPKAIAALVESIVEKKMAALKTPVASASTTTEDIIAAALRKINPELLGKAELAVTPDNLDMNDVLTEPVTFFAYSYIFGFNGYKKYGQLIENPMKRSIRFHHLYRYSKGTGRGKEFVSMCVAKIYSKKEAEYVRNSPLYGIRFFEDISKASSVDIGFAQKLSDATHSLSGLNDHQIVQKAIQQYKIAPSTDIEKMRSELIHKIAEDLIQDNKKYQNKVASINMTPEDIGKIAKVAVM